MNKKLNEGETPFDGIIIEADYSGPNAACVGFFGVNRAFTEQEGKILTALLKALLPKEPEVTNN